MSTKHVQAELAPHEYEAFQRAVAQASLTVKEGAREAILDWVRQRVARDDPLFSVIGVGKGSRRSGIDHDEIYDED